MMKYHEYLAKRDGISLEEAARQSLAHTWKLAQAGKVMSLITAFVGVLSYEQNVARNSGLASNIRSLGFGYAPLYGYWPYIETDPQTGIQTKKKVREDSFLVSAGDNIPNKDFHSIVLGWVRQYEQEAAVVKYADSNIAFSLAADGTEIQLGQWIYSQMRYGADAANRIFVFEAADNHSWSAKLAIHAMEKNESR